MQERSPSPLRSEEIKAFEQLITQLPNEKEESEQSQQLPSYEEEEQFIEQKKEEDSLPPLVDEKEQTIFICPFHDLPVHHHVSKNGWAYVSCVMEDCPVWLAEKAEPVSSSRHLFKNKDYLTVTVRNQVVWV